MKKIVSILGLSFIIFSLSFLTVGNTALGDWWERPSERPTAPAIVREGLPTTPVQQPTQTPSQNPTQPPVQPTVTPRVGGLPSPTPTPAGGGGGTTGDPCAAGKSYVGPYCGWSPSVGGGGGGGGGTAGGGGEQAGAAESGVLGLSYTSGEDLTLSDIMLLAGALCLLLYVRSKVLIKAL